MGVCFLFRRKSALLGGFTNAQLTEHYANCIKLSAENVRFNLNLFAVRTCCPHVVKQLQQGLNISITLAFQKINSKNAFGLHLIDYMSDMLKKKEITNFQVWLPCQARTSTKKSFLNTSQVWQGFTVQCTARNASLLPPNLCDSWLWVSVLLPMLVV